jgi:hypothetical protein
MNDNHAILNRPIGELAFSETFKTVAKEHGFSTLSEILYLDVPALLALRGFDYHIMTELVQFLEDHNAAHLLKQK